ncbi:hypothetical protein L1049_000077 [Liquidambar formosana]|uniref:Uncharacterized protein n=1 Tax=Liquidambar formosana TaxID=63359 RepID=A0AAP0NBP7_LIQFO
MENGRRKKSSSEFSFPGTPNQDQDNEFEFGCVTPGSPFNDPNKNSPADHLFFNGRLLPHAFPIQTTNFGSDYLRLTSRTSSVGSKDSLMSSRSNSTSSRSSSCSSARTSSSDNSERKLLYSSKVAGKNTPIAREGYQVNRLVLSQPYGSSKRWHFITPAPVLNPEVSRRKKAEIVVRKESKSKKQADKRTGAGSGFGRRFFWLFLSACKECHAIEPSAKDDVLRQ